MRTETRLKNTQSHKLNRNFYLFDLLTGGILNTGLFIALHNEPNKSEEFLTFWILQRYISRGRGC